MSKSYTNVSTQTAVSQTSNKTFYITADVYPASLHRFAELIKDRKDGNKDRDAASKIRFAINDFRNGKGDQQVMVYCNITINEFEWLYRLFINGRYNDFKRYIKSEDAYVIREGEFAGLCRVRLMEIKYDATRNYPFKVSITSGYGKEGKITAGKSYAEFSMTEEDLYSALNKTKRYLDVCSVVYGMDLVKNGMEAYAAATRREPEVITENGREYVSAPEPVQQPAPQSQQAVPQAVQENLVTVQTPNGELLTVTRELYEQIMGGQMPPQETEFTASDFSY